MHDNEKNNDQLSMADRKCSDFLDSDALFLTFVPFVFSFFAFVASIVCWPFPNSQYSALYSSHLMLIVARQIAILCHFSHWIYPIFFSSFAD